MISRRMLLTFLTFFLFSNVLECSAKELILNGDNYVWSVTYDSTIEKDNRHDKRLNESFIKYITEMEGFEETTEKPFSSYIISVIMGHGLFTKKSSDDRFEIYKGGPDNIYPVYIVLKHQKPGMFGPAYEDTIRSDAILLWLEPIEDRGKHHCVLVASDEHKVYCKKLRKWYFRKCSEMRRGFNKDF